VSLMLQVHEHFTVSDKKYKSSLINGLAPEPR
jgi:hypothetical protein